jgi:hypothetical protein
MEAAAGGRSLSGIRERLALIRGVRAWNPNLVRELIRVRLANQVTTP